MAAMREQIVAASKPGEDGLPVFNLFVRTKTGARVRLLVGCCVLCVLCVSTANSICII